ncbi:hypothetical protein T11_15920 [Trichinella zimbabwensis]|uniref:Uncharacterized protein n=2 Tax=Trichinella TaxID=6333 RepID=A0A0V1GA77_9BILA|nr:hypothetical protein T11_872 [Trichinella zimbabwensis]KRY96430.1 hypothetical protein T11_15920 [Trichinella zimbabwensis]KRZ63876.1 hypothetical protein T10_10758 [Trichinella papuae]
MLSIITRNTVPFKGITEKLAYCMQIPFQSDN